MPWASEYPAISRQRSAEIRAQIDEAYEQDRLAWEAELEAQIRWVNSGITWVEIIKEKRWIRGQWKSENPSKKVQHSCVAP